MSFGLQLFSPSSRMEKYDVDIVLHNSLTAESAWHQSCLGELTQLLVDEERHAFEAALAYVREESDSYGPTQPPPPPASACSKPRDVLRLAQNNATYERCLLQLLSDHALPLLR